MKLKNSFLLSSLLLCLITLFSFFPNQNTVLGTVKAAEPVFVFSENFDQEPTGRYTLAQLQAVFNPKWENGVAEGFVSVVDGAESFSGKSLKVKYPQGWSSEGIGALFIKDLPTKHDELYYSYRVKFAPNFNFVKGGKLPGIAGGLGNTGNKKPTGYDGWSVRTMWRRDGAIVQYVYHPDQIEDHGDDLAYSIGGQKHFTPGKWHLIQGRVKLNTPGQHDGIVQAWLDGSLAVDKRDLRFREVEGLQADKLRFETFFGGNDSTWGATKDEFTTFDDLQISTQPFSVWNTTPAPSVSPTPSPSASPVPSPVASPTPVPTPKPSPSPTISPINQLAVTYTQKSEWNDGFCVEFKVSNTSATTVNSWQASFIPNQTTITSTWNASFIKPSTQYVVSPVSWAMSIKPGSYRTFGYCGDKEGSNFLPSDPQVIKLW